MSVTEMARSCVVAVALIVLELVFAAPLRADDRDAAMDCAVRLFAPVAAETGVTLSAEWGEDGWLKVRRVESSLPVQVYEATLSTRRPGWRITFSPQRNCTLIGGDVNDVLGVQLRQEELEAFALTQYNGIAGEGRGSGFDEPLVAAQDVLRLLSIAEEFVVLNSVDDIPGRKQRMGWPKRRALNALRARIVPPTVERNASGMVIVRFFSWHKWGGSVGYNSVLLHPDGRVSLSRSTLATWIGDGEVRAVM
jgi:hypothetical protein